MPVFRRPRTIPAGSSATTFTFSTATVLNGWMILSASYGGAKKAVTFTINTNANAISATFAAPANNATISGRAALSVNAVSNSPVSSVQFSVDGASLGSAVTATGSCFGLQWDSTGVPNGTHTLTAVASNWQGGAATTTASVTVDNPLPPVISAVTANAISATEATVTWTTDKASDSQVAYGATSGYGFTSLLDTALVTSHSVNLTGLSPSTVYHFQVRSREGLGLFSSSSDFTFTTPVAPPQVLLQFHSDETEVSSGLTNGSVVTPTIGPAGFTGKLVVKRGGAVAFTPAQSGNGVYFTNCCINRP